MTEQELLEQLTLKLERMEAAQACRNLMGKYAITTAPSETRNMWALE